LPGPRGWVPLALGLMSVFCFPFWVAGLAQMLGTFCSWIVGTDETGHHALYTKYWATLFIAIGMTITLLQTYGFLERAELVIVGLLLLCLGLAAIVSGPNWLQVAIGAVVPRVPEYEQWVVEKYPDFARRTPWLEMMTIVGAVGGGTYDYIGYLGMIREKGWGLLKSAGAGLPEGGHRKIDLPESPEEFAKARTWLRAPIIDTGISFTTVMIFSSAFLILGTTILRPDHLIPDDLTLLKHQARFLTDIQPWLLYVYQVGIFFAFFGTVIAAYEVNTRTTIESLWGISPRLKRFPLPRVRVVVVLYCGLAGLLMVWAPFLASQSLRDSAVIGNILAAIEKPVGIVTIPAVLGGVFTCGLWCFAVLWAEQRFLKPLYRMNRFLFVATIVAGTALTAMGVFAIFDLVKKIAGS
jgi:hypothetical protein